jgi:hypothetical protein
MSIRYAVPMILGTLGSGFSPAVVAAVVSATVVVVAAFISGASTATRDRHNSRRTTYSGAYSACVAYREMAFRIRRRQGARADEDRRVLASEMAAVATELAGYVALMHSMPPRMCKLFMTLVEKTREVADAAISDAWRLPPADSDAAMIAEDIDFSSLTGAEAAYLQGIGQYLGAAPAWYQRVWRSRR